MAVERYHFQLCAIHNLSKSFHHAVCQELKAERAKCAGRICQEAEQSRAADVKAAITNEIKAVRLVLAHFRVTFMSHTKFDGTLFLQAKEYRMRE